MEKSPGSQFGLFNPRVLLAFILCSVAVFLAALGFATTPTPPGWAAITPPNIAQDNALNTVTCASASDCWAVGYYNQALILRRNGTAWSIVASPNNVMSPTNGTEDNYLSGVACASASQCWAVGSYQMTNALGQYNERSLIEKWDGSSWSIVPSPNTTLVANTFIYAV